MLKRVLVFTVILLHHCFLFAQDVKRLPASDIKHYLFNINVSDASDVINGEATITILFLEKASEVRLDLAGKSEEGKGMTVTTVIEKGNSLKFAHTNNVLSIEVAVNAGETRTFTIRYDGVPIDGLIISKNKYGHRTFFADNWPDRAHNWIPCKDDPADKASVEFVVEAPEHYQVVSNGLKTEETNLLNHLKRTHWSETVDLPTKVMVIGLADFAVNYAGDVGCIPVYSWVFPENLEKGFYDYSLATGILTWFIREIGPYPYRKLANVQSKTRFGGMENASAIFYFENSVKGDRSCEPLLAHEIAHQWFGNSATEINWHHVWLSEGFATYMTQLFLEGKYGSDTLLRRMANDRKEVIAFSKKKIAPVVDTLVNSNYMQLLNENSYQKGGWVLHMLRHKLGDSVFLKGIRSYYAAFAGKNASTEDFMTAMEATSRQDLKQFFKQWLYTPGQPELLVRWHYDQTTKIVNIVISQTQARLFDFPLTIQVITGKTSFTKTIDIKDKTTTLKLPTTAKPVNIVPDPQTWLLFSGSVEEEL